MKAANLTASLTLAHLYGLSHGAWHSNLSPKSDNAKTRKLIISEDDDMLFKSTYNQNDPEIVKVEFTSTSNSISVNGESYSFHNVRQYSVLTPEFEIYLDGERMAEEVPLDTQSPVYFGKDGTNEIFVSHDVNRRIDVIEIFDGENVRTLVPNVMEEEKTNNKYSNHSSHERLAYLSDIYDESGYIENFFPINKFAALSPCTSVRQINVAIAFDSSFCSWVGGVGAALQKIQFIVAMTSNKYRQMGLCMTVRLSVADARCDNINDPYKNMNTNYSGCSGQPGLLHDFMSYWDYYMKMLPRDAAHLFTATKMDSRVGCAGIGVLCKRAAYGVEQINFSSEQIKQAILFAHELGHNCGANHVNEAGYIMNPKVTDGHNGFSNWSVAEMNSYLDRLSCLDIAD